MRNNAFLVITLFYKSIRARETSFFVSKWIRHWYWYRETIRPTNTDITSNDITWSQQRC